MSPFWLLFSRHERVEMDRVLHEVCRTAHVAIYAGKYQGEYLPLVTPYEAFTWSQRSALRHREVSEEEADKLLGRPVWKRPTIWERLLENAELR